MYEDVIDLLKAHDYFRGISGAVLGEIASLAKATNYEPAAVIHQLNDPLTSICFILRGRLKAVRVDSRGDEHLFQIFERGDQYGMMFGGLGESIPVRIFALEPSTILSLDYEKALELMLLTPTYAGGGYRRTPAAAIEVQPAILARLFRAVSQATESCWIRPVGKLDQMWV